jgi:hypothetical protein
VFPSTLVYAIESLPLWCKVISLMIYILYFLVSVSVQSRVTYIEACADDHLSHQHFKVNRVLNMLFLLLCRFGHLVVKGGRQECSMKW